MKKYDYSQFYTPKQGDTFRILPPAPTPFIVDHISLIEARPASGKTTFLAMIQMQRMLELKRIALLEYHDRELYVNEVMSYAKQK